MPGNVDMKRFHAYLGIFGNNWNMPSGAEGGHQNRSFLLTYRRQWDKFLTLKLPMIENYKLFPPCNMKLV